MPSIPSTASSASNPAGVSNLRTSKRFAGSSSMWRTLGIGRLEASTIGSIPTRDVRGDHPCLVEFGAIWRPRYADLQAERDALVHPGEPNHARNVPRTAGLLP